MAPIISPTLNNSETTNLQSFLEINLQKYNSKKTGFSDYMQLGFYLKRDDDVIGGIVGYVYSSLLTIETFWVNENVRGLGYGISLLNAIEEESKIFGCNQSSLETYTFQSINFYLNRGYQILATIPIDEYEKIFLIKKL